MPGPLRPPPRDLFLVDLDAFYVSVERRRDPRLRGRPVIVGGRPGERGVVACASYEARAFGIHAGMPLFQAEALAPRDTVFLHGDHAAYLAASRAVKEILQRYTPQVEPVSLDEAYLDMTGLERHHRSCRDAGVKIQRAVLDETGLDVSVGIGGTRAVAKIAADLAKPAGVLEIVRGEEGPFLAALPLEILPGVGPRLRQELARFNLHTIGDLAVVPEDVLEETFGAVGLALARRARGLEAGEDEVPVGEREPHVRSISRETSFARDTDDLCYVDGMISYLAQRATKALRTERLLARAVGVRLRYADFKTVEMRRRLPHPTDLDDEILALARALWRRRYDRRVKLRLVGVTLHDLVPAGDRQLELPLAEVPQPATGAMTTGRISGPGDAGFVRDAPWTGRASSLRHRLDEAVDRVRERHGFGALVRGGAIDLLRKLPASTRGFRLHTPSCSR